MKYFKQHNWFSQFLHMLALLVFSTISILSVPHAAAQPSTDFYCGFQVIGYYPDYNGRPIPDFRYDKLTQVIFFSIYPDTDASLNTMYIDLSRQTTFVQAAHTANVPALICVGGWDLSANFSSICVNASTRSLLVNNLRQYCLTYNFDGIVLDWEPVDTSTDQANYTLLINELKAAIVDDGLTVSVAVGALGHEFNTPAIDAIDWLHIMAYDMYLPDHSNYEDTLTALDHWDAFGFDREKIILGLPFYGKDSNSGYYSYASIMDTYAPGPDIDMVNGIYFNGIDTIRDKTRYVIEQGYGGVMFWEITHDTDDHTSLLTAISDEIHYRRAPDFDCNGTIDLADMNTFAEQWLMTNCQNSNAWCDTADRNQSGAVTLADMVLIGQYWLND